ncbi:uridine cytidine kinase I, putative [Entamoeba dispar SAW760]|uniref:Uridine cytidine kinase I, putative n=1 Tax=Entamoeba dispar (strain ATCC PRA-260 / SAW760) TaxID=370354 RepID=B0EM37_ENTDS|nr:uridine cytidine kinase I, putative [Entamoeba dispar SAW760]EDR24431.1 uridine cytidine kinase I, putative [Entamoeba dispar SAW760]|eukprot:EDR24431.1 uridine cytidine kinase I, putative [Entamoeba dispar SAW760]
MSSLSSPTVNPSTPSTIANPIDISKTVVTFTDGTQEIHTRPLHLTNLLTHPSLNNSDLVGIMVNGRVYSTNAIINIGIANITPVFLNSYEGFSIYRRSLVMVFATAAFMTYGTKFGVTVEHHVNNGYCINKSNGKEFTEEECNTIKNKMKELINENKEIKEVVLSHAEAINYFTETNRGMTLSLLKSTNNEEVKCSYLEGFMTLFIRPLLGRTGILKDFNLILGTDKTGMMLLFPQENKPIPKTIKEIETKKIIENYKATNKVARAVGIECIGDLNKKIIKGDKTTVMMMENRQDMEIAQIAEDAIEKIKTRGVKLISIAGPSASGKTTFSKKLGVQLKLRGITPVVLSTDDYYKHRVDSPKDEYGNYDFECLEALRLDDLNDTLTRLFRGEEVHPYVFDFVSAPLTQLNIDEYNFIGNQVLRFYRRIVRDYLTRNYTASHTLKSWFSVAKGEEKYIFPFVDQADKIWNSSMDYEIAAIYPYVLPLLKTVPVDDPNYNMARNLLDTLELFMPVDDHLIGSTSLIREFIGGSVFE